MQELILQTQPFMVLGSQTSTVLPEQLLHSIEPKVYLNNLPKSICLDKAKQVVTVEGPVTWQELNQELAAAKLFVASSPTCKLATVLAGLSTSCTGEDSFRYKTLREQVVWVEYLNHRGELCRLHSDQDQIVSSFENYFSYRETMQGYRGFKNAPFPLIHNDIDLFIGSEGQLGIVTSVGLKVHCKMATSFLLIPTGNWKQELSELLVQREKLLGMRDHFISFEFFDQACLDLISSKELLKSDYLALEIEHSKIDEIWEQLALIYRVDLVEKMSLLESTKWHELRAKIPTEINEVLAREKLVKMGTDIQAAEERFIKLMQIYQQMDGLSERTYLFGHFGDCHLHFNFLPRATEKAAVEEALHELYLELARLGGFSPFAEHGVGLLKQEFVKNFWYDAQYSFFQELKDYFDPKRIFFPSGYMGLKAQS